MTKAQDLARLIDLAQLTLDHRLSQLRTASLALERSQGQMAEINRAANPADLPLITSARTEWTYQRWADLRRAELNLVIARQKAEYLSTCSAAKTAFGRVQALRNMSTRV